MMHRKFSCASLLIDTRRSPAVILTTTFAITGEFARPFRRHKTDTEEYKKQNPEKIVPGSTQSDGDLPAQS